MQKVLMIITQRKQVEATASDRNVKILSTQWWESNYRLNLAHLNKTIFNSIQYKMLDCL